MKEMVFRYGEGGHGLGVLTLPAEIEDAPIVVLLNAGLLHRSEPYRLNVLVSRRLAAIGYICLRVDLSGKGDTLARKGLANRESVATDWSLIKRALLQQFGQRAIVLFGLCSGADNGVKLCAQDSDVRGLILIDPVCYRDSGFFLRRVSNNLRNISSWMKIPRKIFRLLFCGARGSDELAESRASLRDSPDAQDYSKCFEQLTRYNGRIMAIFTGFAMQYYNKKGQFAAGMRYPGLESICDELFLPNAQHIFTIQRHRDQVTDEIFNWGKRYVMQFRERELA